MGIPYFDAETGSGIGFALLNSLNGSRAGSLQGKAPSIDSKYTDLTKSIDERLKDRGYMQDALGDASNAINQGGTLGTWPTAQFGEDLTSGLSGDKDDEEPESEFERRGRAIENFKNLYPGLTQETISPETDPLVFYEPGRSSALAPEDRPEGMNRGNQYLQDSIDKPISSQEVLPYTAPRSQQEAWYNYAATHDVKDEYKGDLGYINLLASGDSDTIAEWAKNDPMMMMRLLNSGVDIADQDNLSKNIYDYMWGDNAISLYDYMTSPEGYDLGHDAGMITELANYLSGSNYNYGFPPEFAEQYGLDLNDLKAQMLARQVSNYGLEGMNIDQLNEGLGDYLNGGKLKIVSKDSDEAKSSPSEKPKKYGNIANVEQYDAIDNFFDKYLPDSLIASAALNDPSLALALIGTRTQKAAEAEKAKAALSSDPTYNSLPY